MNVLYTEELIIFRNRFSLMFGCKFGKFWTENVSHYMEIA